MSAPLDLRASLDEAERDTLLRALAESHGLIEPACELMGIARSSIYRLIKKHGLVLRRVYVATLPANGCEAARLSARQEVTP